MKKYDCTKYKYGQYKNDIFNKMGIEFERGKKLLDVGCGDGIDCQIFINEFGLDVYGMDIYEHENIKDIRGLKFKKGSILNMPFTDDSFDYVFAHDVLHHIKEENQRFADHIKAFKEMKRVCKKKGGKVIVLEANRYNPLFYPHMVLMKGHKQFSQAYFQKIIKHVFLNVEFKYFEAHFYPKKLLPVFKIYEKIMENTPFLRKFLAYNLAIVKNDK